MPALGTANVPLNEDLLRGFAQAANSNQTFMALQHAIAIFEAYQAEIGSLRAEIEALKTQSVDTPTAPRGRRPAKKGEEAEAAES